MRKPAVVPAHTVRYFGPGEHCSDPQLGAMFLVRSAGIPGKIIRFGQWLHIWVGHLLFGQPYAPWWRVNHAMTCVETGADPNVAEQVGRGGVISSLLTYKHLAYAVVEMVDPWVEDEEHAAAVGTYYAGIDYGWPSIVSDAIYILTGLPIFLTVGQSAVCSTAATEAQRCFGLIPPKPDLAMMPADDAQAFGVVIPLP